jgi:hypothetical protein
MDVDAHIDATVRALLHAQKEVDQAIKSASQAVGSLATRTMKQQIVGGHPVGKGRDSGSGIVAGKPSNMSGNLRRSIRSKTKQEGFGTYTVVTGAYQIYARALEFGHPRWANGVRYPFVAPTAKILLENNRARDLYVKAMRRALGKRGVL